jgi:hypothetical protein
VEIKLSGARYPARKRRHLPKRAFVDQCHFCHLIVNPGKEFRKIEMPMNPCLDAQRAQTIDYKGLAKRPSEPPVGP